MTAYVEIGPIFHHPELLVDKSLKDMEGHLADEGVRRIRAAFGRVLKRPTGHLASRVVKDLSVAGYAVTNSGVVYGPWIEGVSSRNTRSRFKGYATFRKVGQQLQADAGTVLRQDETTMIRGLGGGN